MRMTYGWAIVFLSLAQCRHDATTPLNTDSGLCADLAIPSTPSACPYPYQALDANTAAQICNDANTVSGTVTSTCESGGSISGTWLVGKPNPQHLTVNVQCAGDSNDDSASNVWLCSLVTASLTFADASEKTFASDSFSIQSCRPPTFDLDARSADGWKVHLGLIADNLARGTFALSDANNPTTDPKAVTVGFTLGFPGGRPYTTTGALSSGTVTFTEVSLDPGAPLALTLDANITAPTSDVQEDMAIYCSNNTYVHAGMWLYLDPASQEALQSAPLMR